MEIMKNYHIAIKIFIFNTFLFSFTYISFTWNPQKGICFSITSLGFSYKYGKKRKEGKVQIFHIFLHVHDFFSLQHVLFKWNFQTSIHSNNTLLYDTQNMRNKEKNGRCKYFKLIFSLSLWLHHSLLARYFRQVFVLMFLVYLEHMS